MADKINLRADELNSVSAGLAAFHEEQIKYIRDVISIARIVGVNGNIFSTKSMSDSIDSVLALVDSELFNNLQDKFSESERIIDEELTNMKENDA